MSEKEATIGNSLADALAESMNEISKAANKNAQPEPPAQETAPEEPAAETVDSTETVEPSNEEEAQPQEVSDQEKPTKTQEPETLNAKEHWTQEEKDYFAKLDNTGKKLFSDKYHNLESGFNKKFSEAADARKFFDEIKPLVAPYEQKLRSQGLSVSQGLQQLIAAQDFLDRSPDEGLAWLIQNYAVRDPKVVEKLLTRFGIKPSGDTEEEYESPSTRKLREELNQLKGYMVQKAQNEHLTVRQQIQQRVDAYRSEKNPDGTLKRPHFERLEPEMARMISANPNLDWDTAYQRAMWIDDELRSGLLEREKQTAIKAKDDVRKQTVQSAKAASRNATAKKPAEPSKSPFKTWEDELRATLNEIRS